MKLSIVRTTMKFRIRPFSMVLLFPILMLCTARNGEAEDTLGGHIGFVLPLVTHAGGQTTNLADNFGIGFPVGITVKGSGRLAFDLKFVPFIQNSPRKTTVTVHPGLLYGIGHGFTTTSNR